MIVIGKDADDGNISATLRAGDNFEGDKAEADLAFQQSWHNNRRWNVAQQFVWG